MTTTEARYADMRPPAPDSAKLAKRYEELVAQAEACTTDSDREEFVKAWQAERNAAGTWTALARLRFQQDTRDEDRKAARTEADRITTELTGLDARVKRVLLADPAEWERQFGSQALALWKADLRSFEPEIADAMLEEQRICSEYVGLLGSAEFDVDGESVTLSSVTPLTMDSDRDKRYAAEKARWSWFAENSEQLDSLFDQLVRGRDAMARTLGYSDFVAVGYERMRRVDYDKSDVERFRAQVREKLVPLCSRIAEQQAETLGLDALRFWDEKIFGTGKGPAPLGGHDWMVERAGEMFGALSSKLASFHDMMVGRNLTDLEGRDGKAFGGFCTYFHSYKVPFIFANFNGTRGDVRVFTHEMGHAFQRYSSRDLPLADYVGCTSESAEIHSMSLEFLTWPQMECFFGDQADEFRRVHLLEQLLFLPYGVAIDHFQHEIYENPEATPAERNAMWKRLEATYLPWRNFGDLPHVLDGGFWQMQRHIYIHPFYYIDYTLAATCALQFWARSLEDHAGAMKDFEALCARGGSLPFRGLTASAGLVSPFEDGCLDRVIDKARDYLEF